MKILYAEDSKLLNTYVAKALRSVGDTVDVALDGEKGYWLATSNRYDAIILDVMLPKMSGLDILEKLRDTGNDTPILLLTAMDAVDDRVRGLSMGADDYLTKPFDMAELIARLQALHRRHTRQKTPNIHVGKLTYQSAQKKFTVDGELLDLSRREFALLELFTRKVGVVLSRNEIEDAIYEENVELMSNSVNSTVSILRKKLAEAGCGNLIHTRRGLGYVMEEASS